MKCQLKQAILGHVELVAIEPLQIFCPYIFIKNSIYHMCSGYEISNL